MVIEASDVQFEKAREATSVTPLPITTSFNWVQSLNRFAGNKATPSPKVALVIELCEKALSPNNVTEFGISTEANPLL